MPSVFCIIKQSFGYQFDNWGQGGVVNILVVSYILYICGVIYFCNQKKNPANLWFSKIVRTEDFLCNGCFPVKN